MAQAYPRQASAARPRTTRPALWHTAVFAEKDVFPMASEYVFTPHPVVSIPVVGQPARFPVHRIYCVGRNYEEHAKEMGFTGREPPFFFMKPADAVVVVDAEA